MLICIFVTELQLTTFILTLYYYLLYGYNFGERNKGVKRTQKEKKVV